MVALDRKWWDTYGPEIDFDGERWSAVGDISGVGCIPGGAECGNSGAACISLAVHYGATRVILLGYDCKAGADGKRHWHGKHKGRLTDAGSLEKFSSQIERIIPRLAGVEVLNATIDTALNCFPKVTLESALNG